MSISPVTHPLSRKSDSKGLLLTLDSTLRLNCDNTITGVSNSLANIFKPRVSLIILAHGYLYLLDHLTVVNNLELSSQYFHIADSKY